MKEYSPFAGNNIVKKVGKFKVMYYRLIIALKQQILECYFSRNSLIIFSIHCTTCCLYFAQMCFYTRSVFQLQEYTACNWKSVFNQLQPRNEESVIGV